MRKVPTVFQRDPDNLRRVLDKVTPGCEWVFDDPAAIPTRQFDGTCVLVCDGVMFALRKVKPGKRPPPDFELIEADETGRAIGWVPVTREPQWQWHREAALRMIASPAPPGRPLADGTYELVGPKINGNPEGFDHHLLVRHGAFRLALTMPALFAFDALRDYLLGHTYEGIVWHHPDGRMAKLKRRDFA